MNLAILIDGPSAAIVFGGTAFATLLRSGGQDCGITLRKLAQLPVRMFDAEATRAQLAQQVQEIQADGLFRAQPHHLADREFEEAADALIGQRSVTALFAMHEAHKARRLCESERAIRTLAQAAELAPVFGLAGTLISLSQLPADGLVRGAFTGSIAMAVVTTLYGLLGANLLLAPLARTVERHSLAEEAKRQEVLDWLAAQVGDACPPRRSAPHDQRAAA